MPSTYPVNCPCGQTHRVPGTDAGRMIACSCGKPVEIPTLRELKRSVGEPTASAEIEIGAKLADQLLPEETECMSCHVKTDDCVYVDVKCESQETVNREGGLKGLMTLYFLTMFFGLILAFFIKKRLAYGDGVIHGRDVAFRLPLRICQLCRENNKSLKAKELLVQIPLYHRLLQKYPHSTISKIQSP